MQCTACRNDNPDPALCCVACGGRLAALGPACGVEAMGPPLVAKNKAGDARAAEVRAIKVD